MRYRLLASNFFRRNQSLYAIFNGLGEGRSGFAVNNLIEALETQPGLRQAFDEFRSGEQRKGLHGFYRGPSSEEMQLNRGFWEQLEEALSD